MAQLVRALTAFSGDLGSGPSLQLTAYSCLNVQIQGIKCLLLASAGTAYT